MWALVGIWARRAAVAAVAATGAGAVGTGGYWTFIQPDPQIIVAEAPIVNAGVDLAGVNYTQWVNSGQPPQAWKPLEQRNFKAGTTFFTLRHDCFLYKTSGPITRVFRSASPVTGGQNGQIYQLPMIYPPTRTSGCKRANFATQIPADLPPGEYTYEVAVLFYKNPMQPEIRTLFPTVALTVVP